MNSRLQMSHLCQVAVAKCPTRFQLIFLQACAVTLLVWLVLHSLADGDTPGNRDTVLSFSKRPGSPRKRMLVLLWNDYFSRKGNWLPSTLDLRCPVADCDTTSDRSLLLNSSAVVLHWRSINLKDLPHCDPSTSDPCPLWVLFNKEPPPQTYRDTLKPIEGRFHWTATYSRDSDIFTPYAKIIKRDTPHHTKTVLDPNKRLVCWLVSHCNTPSKREIYVNELEKHIDVDKYGKCRNMRCPYKATADCYLWLSHRCLFYLSLENSFCKEYTTEKLYYTLSTDMIPIVMGNNSNYEHLPPRSYINALDFSGPKELAKYLLKVEKDVKLYQSYFAWKEKYEVKDYALDWYCDLCAKLHSTDTRQVKPHRELVSWWFSKSVCWSLQK